MGEIFDAVLSLLGDFTLRLLNAIFRTKIALGYWGRVVLGLVFGLVVTASLLLLVSFVMSFMER